MKNATQILATYVLRTQNCFTESTAALRVNPPSPKQAKRRYLVGGGCNFDPAFTATDDTWRI